MTTLIDGIRLGLSVGVGGCGCPIRKFKTLAKIILICWKNSGKLLFTKEINECKDELWE